MKNQNSKLEVLTSLIEKLRMEAELSVNDFIVYLNIGRSTYLDMVHKCRIKYVHLHEIHTTLHALRDNRTEHIDPELLQEFDQAYMDVLTHPVDRNPRSRGRSSYYINLKE